MRAWLRRAARKTSSLYPEDQHPGAATENDLSAEPFGKQSANALPAAAELESDAGKRFTVLCRIDAYADYLAEVEADSAEEAAWLARESHDDYTWEHEQTAEFDARFYVTLDANGLEIESTQTGDI